MNKSEKVHIGIWSFGLHQVTGQTRVTNFVMTLLNDCHKVSLLSGSKNMLAAIISGTFRAFSCDYLYVVPSRSVVGILRDSPIAILYRKKRKVLHIHGNDLMFSKRLLSFFRFIWGDVPLIVPSELLQNYLLDYFSDVSLLENFTVIEGNLEEAADPCELKNELNIVWNSNLMEEKGIFLALKSLIKICNSRELTINFHLFGQIIGTFSKEQKLLIESSYTNLNLIKHGVCSEDYISNLLLKSDIYLFPSTYKTECQPLALINAMCCGLPIVAVKHPPVIETLGVYPGAIICENDVLELTQGVIDARKNLSTSYIGAEYAQKRYSKQSFESGLKSIFEKLL